MAITYAWDCKTVDTYPTHSDNQTPKNTKNDVVYNIHYRLSGSETKSGVEYISDNIGTVTIDVDDLSTFTEFASLNNNIVTGWVTASLEAQSSGSVDVMKAGISQSIADQINPPSVTKYLES